MAYELTLTQSERAAFDWMGDRSHAGKMSDLLCECLKEDESWADEGDITFDVPEHIAWQINELAEDEDYSWTCFNDDLTQKMQTFCDEIV